jgi:hypothetical protein
VHGAAPSFFLQVKLQRAVDLVVQVLSPTNASFEDFRVEPGGSTRLAVVQPIKSKTAKSKVCVPAVLAVAVPGVEAAEACVLQPGKHTVDFPGVVACWQAPRSHGGS